MYGIILHMTIFVSVRSFVASLRKPNQNFLKQNRYILVYISEKSMEGATNQSGCMRGSDVLEKYYPVEM